MIKPEILEKIRGNKILIAQIAELRKVETPSVDRWIETNHPNLMHIKILDLIGESCNIKNIRQLYE